MKYSIKKGLDEIERRMITNVANSLLQAYFHAHATKEELTEYYGWEKPLEEEERSGLINDTAKRLRSEQLILRFYQEHKKEIKQRYDQDPTGDFGIAVRQPARNSDKPGGTDPDTTNDGPGEGGGNPSEPGDDGGRIDDSAPEDTQGQGADGGGYGLVGSTRQADQGRATENRSRVILRNGIVCERVDGPKVSKNEVALQATGEVVAGAKAYAKEGTILVLRAKDKDLPFTWKGGARLGVGYDVVKVIGERMPVDK